MDAWVKEILMKDFLYDELYLAGIIPVIYKDVEKNYIAKTFDSMSLEHANRMCREAKCENIGVKLEPSMCAIEVIDPKIAGPKFFHWFQKDEFKDSPVTIIYNEEVLDSLTREVRNFQKRGIIYFRKPAYMKVNMFLDKLGINVYTEGYLLCDGVTNGWKHICFAANMFKDLTVFPRKFYDYMVGKIKETMS